MPSTEARSAFLHGDYEKAATLYQAQLQLKPNDPELTAELSLNLQRQQKVKEADALVHKALAEHPKSAVLLTSLGEIQYREGTPWLAGATAGEAMKMNPCYAPLRLLNARVYRINSYFSSAVSEIKTAHMLDPHDPQIHRQWLNTLPVQERINELDSYLSTDNGDDPETLEHLHLYRAFLKHQMEEPRKACRLVSDTDTATVPFAVIRTDATHIRAFGLDVKFNGRNARLQIDTGASGLIVSRSVAEHAGLKEFSRTEVSGIGSSGRQQGYTAYADDIKIGSLEFRDCEVDVIEKRSVVNIDGLIGADVFANFLVTLDYPQRKLILGPLPKLPDESAVSKPALETAGNGGTETPSPATDQSTSGHRVSHNRYIAPEMKNWTPIYRIGHNLLLPAALNDTRIRMFILDTGASSTSISPEAAREVTKVHNDSSTEVRGISGKVDKIYSADKVTFRFAHLSQRVDDVLSFSTDSLSKALDMDISGLIGIPALGLLKMEIDYRDGLMNFTYDPNQGYKF